MKRPAIAALLLAACAAPRELPEPSLVVHEHEEYARIRPVAIVVLPVKASRQDVRTHVRNEVYDGLVDKAYSPLSLRKIDQNLDASGNFQVEDVEWDASLETRVTHWRAVAGGTKITADGTARLVHRESGEVLWQLAFQDQVFNATDWDQEPGRERAARALARFVLAKMPERPPLPE